METDEKNRIRVNCITREEMAKHTAEMCAEMDEMYNLTLRRVGLSKREAYLLVRARRERLEREKFDVTK